MTGDLVFEWNPLLFYYRKSCRIAFWVAITQTEIDIFFCMIARYVLENLVWEVGEPGTEGWNDLGQCCCIKSGQGPFLLSLPALSREP